MNVEPKNRKLGSRKNQNIKNQNRHILYVKWKSIKEFSQHKIFSHFLKNLIKMNNNRQ